MNKTAELKVLTRITDKKDRNRLRNEGYLLANVSSKGSESISIAVKSDDFRKTLNKYGRNSVFKLDTSDDESITAMVKDIQIGAYGLEYTHVDFQRVSLTEELKAEVVIKIIGIELLEAKRLILNRQVDMLIVNGLPQAIPDAIEVDVSNLEDGDSISVSDLKIPEGIRLEHEDDLVILSVNEPKLQVEEDETEEVAGEEAVPVIGDTEE